MPRESEVPFSDATDSRAGRRMRRPESLAWISVCASATAWLSFVSAVELDRATPPTGGLQEVVSRWLFGAWVVLGLVALAVAITATSNARSRTQLRLALVGLIAAAAMPVTIIVLIASGYFADSS